MTIYHQNAHIVKLIDYSIPKETYKPARLMIRKINRDTGPVYYFHKTIVENFADYNGSGVIWRNYIKKYGNPELIWYSELYECPIELQQDAIQFSLENNIEKSDMWANMKIENGLDGGWSPAQAEARQRTVDKMDWKIVGQKVSVTKQDPAWKENIGVLSTRKMIETVSNTKWKETIGAKRREKQRECYSDPKWKESTGQTRNKKVSDTKQDPTWKESIGRVAKKKEAQTKSEKEWQKEVWLPAVEQMKTTCEELQNRDIVFKLRKLAKKHRIKLGQGWPRKSDKWIESKITELESL